MPFTHRLQKKIDDRTTKYFVDRTNIEKLRNFFDDILASPLLMITERNIASSYLLPGVLTSSKEIGI